MFVKHYFIIYFHHDNVIHAIISFILQQRKNAHVPVPCGVWFGLQWPVSGKILNLETDLSSLIPLATIVLSMLITGGRKIFTETGLKIP